ncbi:hypothetical protein BDF14DRAFT_1797087 [Spinellus fusiger]|nr:hypothetical protein BDF14DRAFT_1797087 [Spinellus fusiger]
MSVHEILYPLSRIIRATLQGLLFNVEIPKYTHKNFNFCIGSIENCFLTGDRLFSDSIDSTIFLFALNTTLYALTHAIFILTIHYTTIIAVLVELASYFQTLLKEKNSKM